MRDKLKVVHLINNLWVGGAEMMLYKVLSGIDDRFHCVVISMIGISPIMKKRIRGTKTCVHLLRMREGWPTLRGGLRFCYLLVRERPFILQTWMYHSDLLGFLVGKLLCTPHIVWNIRHSDLTADQDSRMTILIAKLCARLSPYTSAVVVNSEAGRNFHSALGYRPKRWAVIPNGFDLKNFVPDLSNREVVRKEIGVASDTILIGLVASLRPMKGHSTFIAAVRKIIPQHPNVHFILVGRDVEPSHYELMGLTMREVEEYPITLLGERTDMPRIMAALDILTSSSHSGEGFSNSIGEAMACGVPCVVTDVGDSARIVGDTGIVVPPNDAQALSEAWNTLILAGEQKRRELGQMARTRMEENFSLQRIVQQYEDLYWSLKEN